MSFHKDNSAIKRIYHCKLLSLKTSNSASSQKLLLNILENLLGLFHHIPLQLQRFLEFFLYIFLCHFYIIFVFGAKLQINFETPNFFLFFMILILDFVTSTLTLHNSCTGVKNLGNDAKKKQIFVIDNEE